MGQVFTSVSHYIVYNACRFFFHLLLLFPVYACMYACLCVRIVQDHVCAYLIASILCMYLVHAHTHTHIHIAYECVNSQSTIYTILYNIGFAWKRSWCHTLRHYNQQINKARSHVLHYKCVSKRLNRRYFFLFILLSLIL